ncbi:Hypothetical predicted protein [Podarcis lilfordi]|uniref:Uncharacterized protein n=1 Tax=Podarcis lilfordi TaxID=74358 RepID=A0AA35K5F5_9SAUR|nr:Hypothetical predicted protein [Podarcis lilfordi]
MKFVCLFFALVFLCSAQADEADLAKMEKQEGENLKDFLQEEDPAGDDQGLQDEDSGPKASTRLAVVGCFGNKGYCLPRGYRCHNGLKWEEKYNNCPFRNVLLCCVR